MMTASPQSSLVPSVADHAIADHNMIVFLDPNGHTISTLAIVANQTVRNTTVRNVIQQQSATPVIDDAAPRNVESIAAANHHRRLAIDRATELIAADCAVGRVGKVQAVFRGRPVTVVVPRIAIEDIARHDDATTIFDNQVAGVALPHRVAADSRGPHIAQHDIDLHVREHIIGNGYIAMTPFVGERAFGRLAVNADVRRMGASCECWMVHPTIATSPMELPVESRNTLAVG